LPAIPAYNEEEVLLQVARGQENAFRQLFLHWYQLLAGYVFRITESKELTEEIVQDVFTKIWMVRETLEEIKNFKHFLLVVSRNQAFDALKKQLKEKKLKQIWEKESLSQSLSLDDNTEILRNSLIDNAIDSLPPRRKEVYLLSRHQRLTYNEIAERLDISRESVKTHLKLATDSVSAYIHSHLAGFIILFVSLNKIF
jgi:RNA polymerase sigma-70 factor (family 1)